MPTSLGNPVLLQCSPSDALCLGMTSSASLQCCTGTVEQGKAIDFSWIASGKIYDALYMLACMSRGQILHLQADLKPCLLFIPSLSWGFPKTCLLKRQQSAVATLICKPYKPVFPSFIHKHIKGTGYRCQFCFILQNQKKKKMPSSINSIYLLWDNLKS